MAGKAKDFARRIIMPLDPFKMEVRNPEVEKTLSDIGHMLKEAMPPGYGFALHIVKYGAGGDMFYTSTLQREDYINLLREFMERHG